MIEENIKIMTIIDEMDKEIKNLTGGKPKEYDVNRMFKESQEIQQQRYGGGANNIIEQNYLDGIREREEEIKHKKEQILLEVDEVEEINNLEEDGIIIKKM